MSRSERERAILEIVEERPIASQLELVEALERRGLNAAQATVSRDIKRLGLVKIPLPSGNFRYLPPDGASPPAPTTESLTRACRQFLSSVEPAESLVVLRTPSGHANALAVAIDGAALPEVVGTVAGDDTVLVLGRDRTARGKIVRRFEGWLP